MLGHLLRLLLPVLLHEQPGQMLVTQNSLHLLVVLVLLLQLFCVRNAFFLSWKERLNLLAGIGLPYAQTGILASRYDVLSIVGVEDRIHLLHTLRMVNFT